MGVFSHASPFFAKLYACFRFLLLYIYLRPIPFYISTYLHCLCLFFLSVPFQYDPLNHVQDCNKLPSRRGSERSPAATCLSVRETIPKILILLILDKLRNSHFSTVHTGIKKACFGAKLGIMAPLAA